MPASKNIIDYNNFSGAFKNTNFALSLGFDQPVQFYLVKIE